MPLGTPRANLEREGEPWYKSGLSLEFTSPVWKTPGPRASIGLPKSSGRHHFHQDACRKYSASAALGMRCGRINAKLVCARVTGVQSHARVAKAGGHRAHAMPDEQQPRAASHATRSAFLALASRARVRDLQHPIRHHTCGVSARWRGV